MVDRPCCFVAYPAWMWRENECEDCAGRNWVVDGNPFVISFPHSPGGSVPTLRLLQSSSSDPHPCEIEGYPEGGLEKT